MKFRMMDRKIKILAAILFLTTGITSAQLPELALQTGHAGEVVTIAFSDDGKYLASAGKDNVVIIWDFNMARQIKRLTGHTGVVRCIKFFHNDNKLVTGGDDGKLLVWDLLSETVIDSVSEKSSGITSFDISSDDKRIIYCGNPGILKLCDIDGNSVSEVKNIIGRSPVNKTIEADATNFIKAGFSNDDKEFIICKSGGLYFFNPSEPSGDRFLRVKQKKSGPLLRRSKPEDTRSVVWVWADGKNEEIIYSDTKAHKKVRNRSLPGYPKVVRWNPETGERAFARGSEFSKYDFSSGSVNADHSLIAAGSEDNSVYIWDFSDGKAFARFDGTSPVSALAFHPSRKNILVSANAERDINVWDTDSKKMLRKLSSTTFPITAIAVNKNEDIVALAGTDNSIKILSISEKIDLRSINENESNISGLGFNSTGTGISSVGLDNRVKFWNFDAGRLNGSLKGNDNPAIFNAFLHLPLLTVYANAFTSWIFTKSFILKNYESLNSMDMSNDNRLIAAGGTGYRSGYFYNLLYPRMIPVHIIDNESQKIKGKLQGHYISVDALAFNTDNTLLASAGHDYKMTGKTILESGKGSGMKSYNEINSVKIWDLKKEIFLAAFENKSPVSSICFASLSDSMLFADKDKNVVLFDYKNNLTSRIQEGTGPLLFLSSDKNLLFQDPGYSMKLVDLPSNSVLKEFKGHSDKITSAVLINDGKRLFTAGWDGTLRLWDVARGTEIVSFYAINENDFLVKTPDNYYFATKDAVKEIGFTSGMKFYPFEQFDLKYNRPDLVLRQIGNASEELLEAYNRAYQKRLKKSGFTEEMLSSDFHVPEIMIENSEAIEPVTSNGNLVLKISAIDTKYPIDRINVWINDVAIFGRNGIDKRSLGKQALAETIDIKMAAGINKIQVSAMNQKGAESLKEIIEVSYDAPRMKPDLYLIALGVSKYSDNRFDLSYASKDAADISGLFRKDTTIFRNINIKTLTDEQVTLASMDEIRSFVRKAGRDDVVMLFIAGHGLLDENLDYYFGTHDMDFNDPSGKGIIYDDIEDLFDGITALKKILFMDTCFSGEVDKEEVELAQATNTEFGNVTFRAAGSGVRVKEAFGAQNTSEIMKELFTDIRKGTGSTIISSAGGAEFAMEGSQWKNGLFTFCVLNGINKKAADLNKDGEIMLSELQDYVRANVSNLSGGRQVPGSRTENISMDFRIW